MADALMGNSWYVPEGFNLFCVGFIRGSAAVDRIYLSCYKDYNLKGFRINKHKHTTRRLKKTL